MPTVNNNIQRLSDDGFVFYKIDKKNRNFITKIYKIIKNLNKENSSSENILHIQKIINKKFDPKFFFNKNKKLFINLFRTKKFSIQYYFYLRVVKPKNKKNSIIPVNFHRESFNSKNKILKKAFNLWIPIRNCNKSNSISFYPKSHKLIQNKDFKIKNYKTNIKKYSTEHKLGYLYKEKEIKFKKKIKPKKLFKSGNFIIFNGELIHGAGYNFSKSNRYSIDMRFMMTKNLKTNMKQGSTGRNYFQNIRI